MREVQGKDFKFTISKLARKRPEVEIDEESKQEFIEEDRTFFCSELVAKAFQVLGILQDDGKSATRYHPHSFSAKGQSFLKLAPGITIGEEQQCLIAPDDEYLSFEDTFREKAN